MTRNIWTATLLSALLTPSLAMAYIGPGAGISAIGAALALVAAVIFAIVGFVWYPVKRMMRKRKSVENQPDQDS